MLVCGDKFVVGLKVQYPLAVDLVRAIVVFWDTEENDLTQETIDNAKHYRDLLSEAIEHYEKIIKKRQVLVL
jgi:hypothetical protein